MHYAVINQQLVKLVALKTSNNLPMYTVLYLSLYWEVDNTAADR